ncbi:MAG: F0F1 ATP synthase subunit A [Alphaproteobacteria bacterium]|nr:F0F1 ATP synthase subunit A [Alphaproteobacteria bacterium]MCB9931154.1 F0F1 ATP synthase subunit A [Alphaproteobacteria bacterium]
MIDPLHQFQIWPILDIHIAGLNLSFTNSSLWMVIASAVAFGIMWMGMRNAQLVPGRMQVIAEMLYGIVANMLRDNVGDEGKKYFPLIFTLFLFVLFGNVLGLIPGSFTFTSHLAVTFFMAAVIFIAVTVIGIVRHGTHFLRLFFPEGAPGWTAVILVPIELVSYLSRPVSLSVRLFANMVVGHTLLKVLGGFAVLMGAAGVLPLALLVPITALEFLVAALQAYVFTILTCIYLHDAIHLH